MNTNINQMCPNHSTAYNHSLWSKFAVGQYSTTAMSIKRQKLKIVLVFKLSPCSKCNLFFLGNFPASEF